MRSPTLTELAGSQQGDCLDQAGIPDQILMSTLFDHAAESTDGLPGLVCIAGRNQGQRLQAQQLVLKSERRLGPESVLNFAEGLKGCNRATRLAKINESPGQQNRRLGQSVVVNPGQAQGLLQPLARQAGLPGSRVQSSQTDFGIDTQ